MTLKFAAANAHWANVASFLAMAWQIIDGKRMLCVLLFTGGWGISSLGAQDETEKLHQQDLKALRVAPSTEFKVRVRQPIPNVELPSHVVAQENALTFFADFDHADENGVPLYLVNRTDRVLNLDSQDHDPYVKLEYRDDTGRWIRAQVHLSSWCGNSYYHVALPSGQHYRFFGYKAKDGAPVTVRYRSVANSELVSNSGAGFINALDLAAAAVDDLAAASVPKTLRSVLDISLFGSSMDQNTPAQHVAALNLLSHYHDNAYYRRQAKRYQEKLHGKAAEVEMIGSLLARPWPVEPDRMGLLNHIEAVISGKQTATPMDDKGMALRVVADLVSENQGMVDLSSSKNDENEVVRRIFEQMGESLIHGNGREADAVAEMLAVAKVTDEFVETDKLRGWLEHANGKVVEASALALSRRGDWQFLAEKGFHLNPAAQILILKALATGRDSSQRVSRNPEDAKEVGFWKHCATEQPIEKVSALQYIGSGGWGHHSFNMILHDPLRGYLEKEADLADKDPQAVSNVEHGYPVAQVLRFVAVWQRKEDIPLFRRFLKHPGFQTAISYESSGRRYEVRRFRVREDAKHTLNEMGVSVPDDLVTQEKIPLPDEPANK